MACVSEWAENHTVTFYGTYKSIQYAGRISSGYIIPNADLRHKFAEFLEASEMNSGNLFVYIGAVAAHEHGEEWRLQMLDYVKKNIDFIAEYLSKHVSTNCSNDSRKHRFWSGSIVKT